MPRETKTNIEIYYDPSLKAEVGRNGGPEVIENRLSIARQTEDPQVVTQMLEDAVLVAQMKKR